MESILSKILPYNSIQIISVFFKEESANYYLMTMNKKGNKVFIKSKNSFSHFEGLIDELNTKDPVLLVIDGKGILNKKIDYNNENDVLWTKNLDYNSIHHLTLKTSSFSFVSFCRKNLADEIIKELNSNKIPLLDFYIGILQTFITYDFLKKDEIIVNETILKFDQNELFEVLKLKDRNQTYEYEIGDEKISSEFLSSYAAGLNYFMNVNSLSKSSSDLIKKDEIIYKKAFNTIGAGGLIFFFLALLFSYFTINYLNTQNATLNLENVFSNQTYQQILDLEKQKENKLKILNETGTFSSKFHSFYINEFTKSVPVGVTLSRLNLSPLKKEIKSNERVNFEHNVMLVNGSFIEEGLFNEWIDGLKKADWIKSMEIIYLKKDKKNILQFELKINV